MAQQTLSFSDDVLATPAEAATLIRINAATLQKWRSTGENNIPYIKIGRSVRYRVSDLRAYVERHVVGG
ncbi:helix-turn-helix domain-containing protein [Methylobacter sp. G7]|uniref:helix-turn-helix domain-containing protein n=1 Tax=Methylobacter sp. G7 TaxID=3230117 RepID=UPI003D809F4B